MITDKPEDPQAAGDRTPDTSRGLRAEIGSAIGDAADGASGRCRRSWRGSSSNPS